MEGTVGAPPQRVCPRCARISWATGPRCPYCRARFRHQSTGTIAWMLALAVVIVLAGVLAMFLIAGHQARSELDDRADQIQQDVDRNFQQLRDDVNRRIDEQLTPVPTPTATPTPTPSPSPTATSSPARTATPTPSATIQP